MLTLKVRTFEREELAPETAGDLQQSRALVEKMGLAGQSEILGDPADASTPPYVLATKRQYRALKMGMTWTPVADYKDSLIPLRALQVAQHALSVNLGVFVCHLNTRGLFDAVAVWDVFLVGVRNAKSAPHDKDAETYLLAQWGGDLHDWAALEERALAVWTQQMGERLQTVKAEVERAADGIREMATRILEGTENLKGSPHFYFY